MTVQLPNFLNHSNNMRRKQNRMQTSLLWLEDTSDSTFNGGRKKNAGKWLFQKQRAIVIANTVSSATMEKGLVNVSLFAQCFHRQDNHHENIHIYEPQTNTIEDRNYKQWKMLENSTTIINTTLLELHIYFVLLHIPHQCTDGLHNGTGLVGTMWYPFSHRPLLCFHLNHQYSLPRHHMPMS